MSPPKHVLQDESALRWAFLEQVSDACVVVSDRMEFVYANAEAQTLLAGDWFGKRCFEVLPTTDETCAFHCQKIRAVTEAPDIVYCEESLLSLKGPAPVFGVGLIPLGTKSVDHARAVFLLRRKPAEGGSSDAFQHDVLDAAEALRRRITASLATAR